MSAPVRPKPPLRPFPAHVWQTSTPSHTGMHTRTRARNTHTPARTDARPPVWDARAHRDSRCVVHPRKRPTKSKPIARCRGAELPSSHVQLLPPSEFEHAHARMSIENAVWVEACPPAQAHAVLCNVQHRSHDRRVRCCCSPPAHLGSVVHASRPLDALVIYRFGEVTRCELSETVRMPSHFPTSLRNAACTRRGRWLRSHTATLPRFMYRTLCAGTWLLFYFKGILRAKKII